MTVQSGLEGVTFGVIVGNRGFFPDRLAQEGREEILKLLERVGAKAVCPTPEQTKFGAVETREEAKTCAELFRARQKDIDGVIVTLPNFGDERAVADTLRLSGLNVPVLIQATPDHTGKMTLQDRRDSFCGKMSVCNNLQQYGIRYSLTSRHTEAPDSPEFARDLEWFAGVCRVVKGLRHARLGAIGARPANFNTVRYSEKLLEASGISVEPVDLAEILGRISRLDEKGSSVRQKIEEIREYTPTLGVPENALVKMAKLAVAVEQWMQEVDVQMSAIQCWTTLEQYYGVVPCTVMSMMSNSLIPAACEVDVCGVIAMYALQLASGTPSALLDWNNNYADDPDKVVCFHCSNLPRHFFADTKMGYQDIIAGTVGKDATFGTVLGRVRPSPMTFARFSTDDQAGLITGYLGEGRFTDDPLETFGGYGVVEIPRLQELLHFICAQGFEHHVAASLSQTARILYEATTQYMDWEIYWHQ